MNTTTLLDLIERLNTLAQNFQPKHIHIDTMLYTTTELYEALINLKSGTTLEDNHNNKSIPTIQVNTFNQFIQNDDALDNDINNEIEALFNSEYDKTIEATEDIIDNVQKKEFHEPQITISEVPFHSTPQPIDQSTEKGNGIQLDLSGINIEFPPATVYKKVDVVVHNIPQNDDYKINNATEKSDKDAAKESESILENNQNKIITGEEFNVSLIPNQKDFKNEIGFNDKYLFMNELFQKNKDLFDATIAKITNSNDLNSAKILIEQEVSTPHHWDKNSSTVQIFYGLLEKYFKTR